MPTIGTNIKRGEVMLCLKCDGQHLTVDTCEKVASGFINANVVHFEFCERWAGTVKTAQFTQRQDGKLVTYSVMIDELAGTAAMPNEVKAGDLLISAFGVDPDTGMRITTTIVAIKVEPSGYVEDGETPIPPTPDLYQQLLEEFNKAAALPVATGDTLGGVKVGSGLSITEDGTLFATGGGGTGEGGTGIVSIKIVEV